jgi:hypothetical protein
MVDNSSYFAAGAGKNSIQIGAGAAIGLPCGVSFPVEPSTRKTCTLFES